MARAGAGTAQDGRQRTVLDRIALNTIQRALGALESATRANDEAWTPTLERTTDAAYGALAHLREVLSAESR